MEFIGQGALLSELEYLINSIESGENYNVLFRAPSGYGKTTLGLTCLKRLDLNNSFYYIPEDGKLNYFYPDRRFHFVDEIHTLTTPEILYPNLDSGEFTFLFATNESGNLKEPLINRCIELIFAPYDDEERLSMVNLYLQHSLSSNFLEEILNRCTTPRNIKNTCRRLDYIFNSVGVPNSIDELNEILEGVMQIKTGGLTNLDQIYLDFLREVGHASLQTIVYGTGLDKNTILRDIEPRLLYTKIIRISSKGRELC